jgi:hypothetical protein
MHTTSYIILSSNVRGSIILCDSTVFLDFLNAFEKLGKATVSSVTSVRPSVRMEQLGSHKTDFSDILYLRIFRKSVAKIQV